MTLLARAPSGVCTLKALYTVNEPWPVGSTLTEVLSRSTTQSAS